MFVLLLITSCNSGNKKIATKQDQPSLDEAMLRANRSLIRMEDDRIQAFLKRYGWKMKKSGTGLYYDIYDKGTGRQPVRGNTVTLHYTLKFLTGKLVYSSENDGPIVATLGKNQMISGLEEGVFLMSMGGKAKFIVPSHLAYGLLGDQEKIPQKATLVYDVTFVSLQQ